MQRVENIFIGENEDISLIAVDIRRRLYTGLDYFVSTRGNCAAVVSDQDAR